MEAGSKQITRRRFLGEASCAAVGTISVLSTLMNLKMANQLAAQELCPSTPESPVPNYKSIVCIFQDGGNDSYNMLVPNSTPEYDEYAASRSNLALPQNTLLPLQLAAPLAGPGQEDRGDFALHPSLGKIAEMFNGTGSFSGNRRLSFAANVGTLIEPTTKAAYLSGSVPLPKALFSHVDQMEQWQTAIPQGTDELSGWAGRAADVMHSTINIDRTTLQIASVPMNISLSGRNLYQSGRTTDQFVISSNGGLKLTQRKPGSVQKGLLFHKNSATTNLVGRQYNHLLQQAFAKVTKDSLDRQKEFTSIFNDPGSSIDQALNNVAWPDTEFGDTLQAAAKTIATRDQLGLHRQTLFVAFRGWDHHRELLKTHEEMLTILSDGLHAFQLALESLGVQDEVVTYTASDFGRTLRSNGRGTDHAWGGNQIILGGPVRGGHIFGSYPSLALDSNVDIGWGGRILPSTPVDGYIAEVLKWFGVSKQNLCYVLPNFENFYDLNSFYQAASPTLPLGYIA